MDAAELLARAVAAPPDSAARILCAVAAVNNLTDHDLILVGGAAQVTHTGVGRLTDIDLVGTVTPDDQRRMRDTGFDREGRHWVYEAAGAVIAVEVPGDSLAGEEPPEQVVVGGHRVAIIAVTDLMMDRLIQSTDGTTVTHDEAAQLAVAAHDRIDWPALRRRATAASRSEPFLRSLPPRLEELHELASRSTD